jgi:hypothetical protein
MNECVVVVLCVGSCGNRWRSCARPVPGYEDTDLLYFGRRLCYAPTPPSVKALGWGSVGL